MLSIQILLFVGLLMSDLLTSYQVVEAANLRASVQSIHGMSAIEYARTQAKQQELAAATTKTTAKFNAKYSYSHKNTNVSNQAGEKTVLGTDGQPLPKRELMSVPIAPGSKILRKRWVVIDPTTGKPKLN